MTSSREVRRQRSDSPWEEAIGAARAVAAGDRVIVSGTKPAPGGIGAGEDEPYEQALSAFGAALAALEPFGLGAADVVRTRMYLTHARDADEVGRAHRELFGAAPPAATTVLVAGFVDSRVLVEVEIEAWAGAGAGPGGDGSDGADEAHGAHGADEGEGAR
jgi:enamine deaminase RidA (YjgF/YER057c/UK114 family)